MDNWKPIGEAADTVIDHLTEKGAHALAAKIKAYWLSEGYEIEVWVESFVVPSPNRVARAFVVRSNLTFPMPIGRAA